MSEPPEAAHLSDSKPSRIEIQVAERSTSMPGSRDGILHALVIGEHEESTKTSLSIPLTTVNKTKLHRELLSVDGFYSHGVSILLKHPDYMYEDGIPQMYKPPTKDTPAITIPFRYDSQEGVASQGCFHETLHVCVF